MHIYLYDKENVSYSASLAIQGDGIDVSFGYASERGFGASFPIAIVRDRENDFSVVGREKFYEECKACKTDEERHKLLYKHVLAHLSAKEPEIFLELLKENYQRGFSAGERSMKIKFRSLMEID